MPKGVCLVDSRDCLKMEMQSQANKLGLGPGGMRVRGRCSLRLNLVEVRTTKYPVD